MVEEVAAAKLVEVAALAEAAVRRTGSRRRMAWHHCTAGLPTAPSGARRRRRDLGCPGHPEPRRSPRRCPRRVTGSSGGGRPHSAHCPRARPCRRHCSVHPGPNSCSRREIRCRQSGCRRPIGSVAHRTAPRSSHHCAGNGVDVSEKTTSRSREQAAWLALEADPDVASVQRLQLSLFCRARDGRKVAARSEPGTGAVRIAPHPRLRHQHKVAVRGLTAA